MAKIMIKKEMDLAHFIAWAVDNHITGSFYANNRVNAKRIRFEFGRIVSSHGELRSHDTFTIGIDEEINENTVIPKIAELNLCGYDQHEELFMNENKSIKQLLGDKETNNKAFYIVNNDYSMTLVWRDGKLV